MMTTDGLIAVLEGLTAKPVLLCLYVNEPDGDVVRRADFEEPNTYTPITIEPGQWKINRQSFFATAEKTSFPFTGKAGKVVGYFIVRDDVVLDYQPFLDPIPINTNEDIIHVRPRIKTRRMTALPV